MQDISPPRRGARRAAGRVTRPVGWVDLRNNSNTFTTNLMNITTNPHQDSDLPIVLEPRKLWSQVLIWLIMSMATSGIAWAAIAQIEQTVPATGKLEPQRAVQEIKAPTGGVIRNINIHDGQIVKQGQLLLKLDPTASAADLRSLLKLKASLLKENQFYTSGTVDESSTNNSALKMLLLLRRRLIAEDRANAQLTGNKSIARTSDPNQQQLSAIVRTENRARIAAATLQIQATQTQLRQTQTQLITAQQSLKLTENIRDRLKPIVAAGAVSMMQLQQREQEVLERRAEVEKLQGEQQRLQVTIAQSQKQLQQVTATTQKENFTKIADNQNRIAEIDTQIGRTQLENTKKIAELDGQISKAKLALAERELRAPIEGIVFNLQPRVPGFVASSSQPLLSIVPKDALVATVLLTNKDIGFVRTGMAVDLNVESFPTAEFGTLNGTLTWIGSDALPPTQERPYYAFPAKIRLAKQFVQQGDKLLPLRSGMAINASIKLRKRTVMSLFLDIFDKKFKSLESVR
jgi:hemolysin D